MKAIKNLPGSMRWARFEELTTSELYEILRLRCDIFVVEQRCAYPDIDGQDDRAVHLLCSQEDAGLAGYLRVLPPDNDNDHVSIGRVVVATASRGTGLGHRLMEEALAWIRSNFGSHPIGISAQAHLRSFYERLGFVVTSDVYDEDGIDHCDMEWRGS